MAKCNQLTPLSFKWSNRSHLSLALAFLLEVDHSVFSSHWWYVSNVGECGRLSQPSWLSGAL